jgi:D-3-phosphoglycerate dehydrogenase
MPVNLKRVFYVKYVASPEFLTVLGRRTDITVDRIEDPASYAEAAETLRAAHAYQIGSARDEIEPRWFAADDLLRVTPNLLAVSTNGAGYDTVDVASCTRAGVLVVNQAGGNAEAVAEHALGMMLILSKRIVETDRHMRRTNGIMRNDYIGRDLFGATIGIIGLGHVGTRLAELCGGLLRMRVLAYDPYLTEEQVTARGAEKIDDLHALLAASDVVSVNCPRTAETRGMIGAPEYAAMQRHAYFITTARGGIHDEKALATALRGHRIAGAGLDVWEKEPPPHDHPLLAFDTVVASPHTAGVTRQSRTRIATIAAEQMIDILDGKRPPRIINPEVWPAYAERFARIMGVTPAG